MIPSPPPGSLPEPPFPQATPFDPEGAQPPSLPDPPGPIGRGLRAASKVTWRWWEASAIYLVGNLIVGQILVAAVILVAAGRTGPIAEMGTPEFVASLAADLAFVAVMAIWLRARHPGWVRALGIPAPGGRARAVAWGIGMGLLLYPAILIVSIPIQLVFEALAEREVTAPEQVPSNLSAAGKAIVVVLAVLVAPVVEELFYRGLFFRSIRDRSGFWVGAVVSSLLFGLVHYVPAPWQDALLLQTIMVFTGIGLAFVYERKGTILAPIAAHFTFNVVGVLIILGAG